MTIEELNEMMESLKEWRMDGRWTPTMALDNLRQAWPKLYAVLQAGQRFADFARADQKWTELPAEFQAGIMRGDFNEFLKLREAFYAALDALETD